MGVDDGGMACGGDRPVAALLLSAQERPHDGFAVTARQDRRRMIPRRAESLPKKAAAARRTALRELKRMDTPGPVARAVLDDRPGAAAVGSKR